MHSKTSLKYFKKHQAKIALRQTYEDLFSMHKVEDSFLQTCIRGTDFNSEYFSLIILSKRQSKLG